MSQLAFLALLAPGCSVQTGINEIYPELAITPGELDFGEVVVDGAPASQTIEVINAGRAPLSITGVSLLGGGQGFSVDTALLGEELLSNDAGTLVVYMDPPNYEVYADTLLIETNDPDFPEGYAIPLTGEGIDAPTPAICVDPLSLDFGSVDVGDVELMSFVIENCGEAPLSILDDFQTGSGAFELASTSPVGLSLDPDEPGYTVNILYDPNSSTGDSGTYAITSDDPLQETVEIKLIGNGGGGDDYPVALIDPCPAVVAPLDTVNLDGTGSTDPDGLPLDYRFTLLDKPDGSQTELQGETTDTAKLFVDAAGDYAVQLEVENSIGVRSAPYVCRMEAIPDDAIHIELTWNTSNTDLDLHLANGADAEFYDEPDDVSWCNPQGNWGDGSTDLDDAFLDIDDLVGFGPENINIPEPVDGEYYIRVHYFEDGGDGSTTATVRVYIEGFLERTFERVMDRNDVWDVAFIRWDDSPTVNEIDAELYTAPTRSCF